MKNIEGKLGVFAAVAAMTVVFGCGGSSSSTTTSAGDDITVSGVVESPSGASASISKGRGSKSLTDTPADGLTVTVYDVEDNWDEVGTGTSSAGTVSVTVDPADIRPADAAAGDAYSVQLALVAENADGTVHIETYVEASVDEGTTTTVDLGTADVDSTLAAQALWRAAGCEVGIACTFTSINPFCYFRAQHQVFSGSSATGDGIADDTAAIRDMIASAMAAGESPADHGYDNWGDLMNATLAGDLPAAAQEVFAGHAQGFVDDAPDGFYEAGYAGGADAFSALDSIIGVQLAGGNGLQSLASLGRQAAASDGSACDNINDASTGDDYVEGLIDTFLACADPTECENVYGDDDCFNVALGVVDEFHEASDLTGMQQASGAIQGYLAGLGSAGCDSFFEGDGTFDAAALNDLHEVFDSFDPADVATHDGARDWGRSWQRTIDAQGFDALRGEDGTIDDGQLGYYGEYFDGQVGNDFDPTQIDFGSLADTLDQQYNTLANDGSALSAYDQCIANGNTFEFCSGGQAPDPDQFEQAQPAGEPEFGGGFACTTTAECDGGFQCIASRCEPPTMPPM